MPAGEKSERLPAIEERIDSLGFGRAQIIVLTIGGVLTFTRSCQMCIMCQLTIPAKRRLDLGSEQAGLLATVLFAGMVIGTFVSGRMGDVMGRRLPLRIGGALVPAFGLLSAIPLDYGILLVVRFCLGFFVAFGDVPLNALMTELTPKRWRMVMRSFIEICYDLGFGYAAVLAAIQDPYLDNVSFAKLTLLATIPPGILTLATIFFMPESPVFLASTGDMERARSVLANLQHLNNAMHKEIDFEPPPRRSQASSVHDSLSTIFGRRYRVVTLTLAYSTLMIKLFYYGGIYSQPQVMTEGHGLLPGWEVALGGPFQIVGAVIASVVASSFRGQYVMIFAMTMSAVGLFCFGFAGTRGSGSGFLLQGMYQFGCMSFYWVEALGIIVLSQLAVEMYPTRVSSTSGSVASASGRVGCLAAPVLFEFLRRITGTWSTFCYLIAGCCLFASLLFAFAWWPLDVEEEEGKDSITLPLKDHTQCLLNAEEARKAANANYVT